MPELASFYGIKVLMFTYDNKQHHLPHIHAWYQGQEAVLTIPSGRLLVGDLPSKKLRMVRTWMDIHADELLECWEQAVNGIDPPKIEPLR